MTVTLDLPEELHRLAEQWANKGGQPLDGFLKDALTMALVGLEMRGEEHGLSYLRERAEAADYEAALAVLDSVPDVPPDPWDTWDENAPDVPVDLTKPAP